MIGEVDNGDRVSVQVGKYVGPATVRVRGSVAQLVYLTSGGYPPSVPRDIVVDGVTRRAIARQDTAVKGMIVLLVEWPAGD